jgi:hypothetical protein
MLMHTSHFESRFCLKEVCQSELKDVDEMNDFSQYYDLAGSFILNINFAQKINRHRS